MIFAPITFATLMIITASGIFDEIKNTKLITNLKKTDIIKQKMWEREIEKVITECQHMDDYLNYELPKIRKELTHINRKAYSQKQNQLKEASQTFICPFSGNEEMILINQQ